MLTVDYDRLALRPGMTVLDLGAGFGRHAFETARRGANVFAVDLARDELVSCANTFAAMYLDDEFGSEVGVGVAQADGGRLPFRDGSFDRIIASEVLEHVPDDLGVMAELWRVLKPGGRMAATVPSAIPEQICWWLNEAYHAPISEGGHVRIYARPELDTKLAASGFSVVDHHRAHALHSPYWWLKCAVGLDNTDHPLVKNYLKLLTWDITDAPTVTRTADRLLNPVLGKSLVVYADRPHPADAGELEFVGAGANLEPAR
ncbi:MAG: class I SAM-dependent methyltransferase [Actinomycetota bacterium]